MSQCPGNLILQTSHYYGFNHSVKTTPQSVIDVSLCLIGYHHFMCFNQPNCWKIYCRLLRETFDYMLTDFKLCDQFFLIFQFEALEGKDIWTNPQLYQVSTIKANLDGITTLLLYATSICHDFQPSTLSQFSLTASTTCHTNVVGLIYTTQSAVKSWCMLVAHDSRKQKLFCLEWPFLWTHMYLPMFYDSVLSMV